MNFLKKLFGRKEESVDISNVGPLASVLRRCKKCDAIAPVIDDVEFWLTDPKHQKTHEHQLVLVSEQSVIETHYQSNELSFLRDVKDRLNLVGGVLSSLLRKSNQARLVYADCLERIAQLEGKIPIGEAEAHYYRAINIYTEAYAHDLAASELEKVGSLVPSNMFYRNQLAIQYVLSNHWQKAEEIWEEILALHPDDKETISNYADALSQAAVRMAAEDPKRLTYFKKALNLQPKSQHRYRDMGMACLKAEKWEDAITYLKKTITYATQPLEQSSVEHFKATVKDQIAICYYNLGKDAEAVRYWEKALVEGTWRPSEKQALSSDLQKAKERLSKLTQ